MCQVSRTEFGKVSGKGKINFLGSVAPTQSLSCILHYFIIVKKVKNKQTNIPSFREVKNEQGGINLG